MNPPLSSSCNRSIAALPSISTRTVLACDRRRSQEWAFRRPSASASAGRRLRRATAVILVLTVGIVSPSQAAPRPSDPATAGIAIAVSDWPQLGRDPQRTNYSPQQVDPPYCYAWKWYEVPIASRAQPIVADGRLFLGALDGSLYARDAATGAPLWSFASQGPIRHSPAVAGSEVLFSSHDGYSYAVAAADGSLRWKVLTGPSATAPLVDEVSGRAFVASTNGKFTALRLSDGAVLWQVDTGAPILTSPSLSIDGQTVFLGNEDIQAIALRASDGSQLWRTPLRGQSLSERYPVVAGSNVIYRSQPVYFFHLLLHEGDDVMDQAGAVDPDWAADWAKVRPQIIQYLTQQPSKQTFFALDALSGQSRGIAPVLYTYGNNDPPNVPVIRDGVAYMAYRARHGIQTDGGAVHVSSRYDAEAGRMDLSTLDVVGLRQVGYPAYHAEFRMTSDEPTILTMGGDILLFDNWERIGGLNVQTGQLIEIGGVSNDWPECYAQCGPGTSNPFFPMSGNPSDPAYPFPSPRVNEGHSRGGAIVANDMIYWRVIEGGLAGISHRNGTTCPAPRVWAHATASPPAEGGTPPPSAARSLEDYVRLDLTAPVTNPPADLVERVRDEVRTIAAANGHWMPFYLDRGFSTPFIWPYDTPSGTDDGPPAIAYGVNGNAYWHDPGELLYTVALAYPYLDAQLQAQVRTYMAGEMQRFPPLVNLPWNDSNRDWLRQGIPRERYEVPFRQQLNNWPPPAANATALYALWLWSKNTGDWSYAQAHWSEATSLFSSRLPTIRYYADIAGAIGYARLAQHFGNTTAYNNGVQAAVQAMQAGLDFNTFRSRAENDYLDGRDIPTGWYLPAFYGLSPEVGLYIRDQIGSAALDYVRSREDGDGLRWWFLTRAGAHAEAGETSYVAPIAGWSHFLAHAYIVGDEQAALRKWLDRPWAAGDLYSIQKTVATIQGTSPIPTPTFVDVPFDHPYHDDIEALYQAGYTAGCNTDPLMYCPENTMNRGESAVFVERGIHAASYDPPGPSAQVFADLALDSWAAKWVNGLWVDGYTAGCGTDPLVYCPWQGHTRAEAAVFYMRMLNGAAYDPPQPMEILFADVSLEAWYAKWVHVAYGAGLIQPCQISPELGYCPEDPLTRAVAAYMMVRAKGLR